MEMQLLSYQELGDRLGIKADSARKLVTRNRWRKVTATNGTIKVHVPAEELPAPASDPHAYSRELEARIESLQALLAAETRRAETAEAAADDWKSQAEKWRAESADWKAQLSTGASRVAFLEATTEDGLAHIPGIKSPGWHKRRNKP